MQCPLCGTGGSACGHPYTGTPVDIPMGATNMAEQGPLVRVDTNGRGYLIKLSPKQAEAYVATHPGASLVGQRPPPAEPASQFIEPVAQAVSDGPDLAKMKKADLVKLAEERGIDTKGTADELRDRLSAEPQPAEGEAEGDESDEGEEPQE